MDLMFLIFDSADGVKSKSYSAITATSTLLGKRYNFYKRLTEVFPVMKNTGKLKSGYLDPVRPNVFLSPFKSKDELDTNRQLHLKSVRRAIEELDVLVFTLGLTEAWKRVSCKSVLPVIPGVLGGSFLAYPVDSHTH